MATNRSPYSERDSIAAPDGKNRHAEYSGKVTWCGLVRDRESVASIGLLLILAGYLGTGVVILAHDMYIGANDAYQHSRDWYLPLITGIIGWLYGTRGRVH